MMKKILLIIIITFISSMVLEVNALQYKDVSITVTFEDDIEFSEVPNVELLFYPEAMDGLDEGAAINRNVILNEENGYTRLINNVNIVDQQHLEAFVSDDRYGKFDCVITLNIVDYDNASILIHVKRNVFDKKPVEIPTDMKNSMINLDKLLEDIKNSSYFEEDDDDEEDNPVIINPFEEEDDDKPRTTTTKSKEELILIEEEKKKKEEEKQESIKKNNLVTKILLITLGIIALILIIIVLIKCVNANK